LLGGDAFAVGIKNGAPITNNTTIMNIAFMFYSIPVPK